MTPSSTSVYGPDDDFDNDLIPNVLEGVATFLTVGDKRWLPHVKATCAQAHFSGLQAARRYCLALTLHPWSGPFPKETAGKVSAVLQLAISGDASSQDAMNRCLLELQSAYPNSMDPIGSFLRSSVRSIPDFASIGIFNSRIRSERSQAVKIMRELLTASIKEDQKSYSP